MTSSATSTVLLRLLVPASALPPEGEETLPAGFPSSEGGGLSRSLSLFQALARPHAPKLALRGTELAWAEDPAAELVLIELSDSGDGESPGVDVSGAASLIDWGAVGTAFARRTDAEHFLGTAEDAQRILLDEIRTAAREAAKFFTGDALPLVEVRREGETTELAFLGIWLAEPGDAAQLSGAMPSGRWAENAIGGETGTLLVLDEPDAEGHGLREMILSVSMLAVVFASPAQAGLLDAFKSGPTPVSHESQAKTDGTPLEVKSQKLVQPAPKIYPSGLLTQKKDAPRRVVVDVKAQRAYLFVDGKLAFETPVSTAAKGRTTPRGTFNITEKVRSGKHSTIYKSAMPFWNRLGESAIGMHTGQLPGYPASHGCIRLPNESARFIFENAPKGTTVQVVDALASAPQPAAPAETLVAAAR
ncbi:MAG TPA: L,D-transpeptidase [Verrucomicrobiales bacterium]|nr:L,D-transpeptidase [Verrucomicrobiales bacterium]